MESTTLARMITRLSHTTINVLDIDKALDVYVNKLGLKVKRDIKMDNGFRWLSLHTPKQPDLEIVLYVPMPGMVDAETLAHLKAILAKNAMGAGVFETDNCQKSYEELKAKGIVFMQPPTQRDYGTEALFTDGCGNWFSLTQH